MRWLVLSALLALPATARPQEAREEGITVAPLPEADAATPPGDETIATGDAPVAAVGGAVLRGLDRLVSRTEDLGLGTGETGRFGDLAITLEECRAPADNPLGDAYALLTIRPAAGGAVLFRGWMIASSPALNPLDHPRYDVWPLRCSKVPGAGVAGAANAPSAASAEASRAR